jgi:hypothetical protein
MDTNSNKSNLPIEILEEVERLFNFGGGSPENIRRSLLEVFFAYLIDTPEGMFPLSYRKDCEAIYFLVEFLNRAEDLIKENAITPKD